MTQLPPSPHELHWLSSVIGDEATLALLDQRGGTRLYIPRDSAGSKLADEIGEPAAHALAQALGGEGIKVPICREWRVRCHRVRGLSYAQIARRTGCSEDTVWRLLNHAGRTNQLDLFGTSRP